MQNATPLDWPGADTQWTSWFSRDYHAWPAWVTGFREHQIVAVEQIVDAYNRGVDVVFLDAPTGCLAGDTTIGINRGGKGYQLPLADLVHRFNGGDIPMGRGRGRSTTWDPTIPTRVRRRDRGVVLLGELAAAVESGRQTTYKVTTNTGRTIRATANHPFFTTTGYRPLADLHPGSKLWVEGPRGKKRQAQKNHYPYLSGLHHHPYAGRGDTATVPVHRLVAEASINNVQFDAFVERIRAGEVCGLGFLDPAEFAVHHVDHNHANNSPENLEVLTHLEHQSRHAEEGAWRNCQNRCVIETIEDITRHGVEETYDLTMVNEPHNFIANGFVVHNSGKTLIAEMTRRLIAAKALYVCHSLGLQDQFLADFPYAQVLKGRSNYSTQSGAFPDITCADCDLSGPPEEMICSWCPEPAMCNYIEARETALASPIAVVNTAYLLAEANNVGRLTGKGEKAGTERDLIIADEADTLEAIVMSHAEFRISATMLRKLKVNPPKKGSHAPTVAAWLTDELTKAIGRRMEILAPPELDLGMAPNVNDNRELKALTNLAGRVPAVAREIVGDGWVRDYDNTDSFILKPVTVDQVSRQWLWRHSKRWLLMSATLVSTDEMIASLGMEGLRCETVTVPMTFPVENRPVHAIRVAEMSAKNRDTAWPQMADGISKILERHPDDKVLVHTVSYKLADELFREVDDPIDRPKFTYMNSGARDLVLAKYRKIDGPAVIYAPSLDRGFDFKGDDARVVIVAKVPYPNLGDKQVSARLHTRGGQEWYTVQTIRSLVQMTGRGVRSAEDWCVSYILDSSFTDRIWRKSKRLLPRWWKQAVKMTARRDVGIERDR